VDKYESSSFYEIVAYVEVQVDFGHAIKDEIYKKKKITCGS